MTETSAAPPRGASLDGAIAALVTRATTDPTFRARALEHPGWAFAEVAGRPLPEGLTLRLFDNAHAALSMVLPDPRPGAAKPADARAHFAPDAEWTDDEARHAADAVAEWAAVDPAFRALALADPAAAIRELTGKALPEGFTVRLFDGAGATRGVVLPDVPEARTELSEAELAAVAGGAGKQGGGGAFGGGGIGKFSTMVPSFDGRSSFYMPSCGSVVT